MTVVGRTEVKEKEAVVCPEGVAMVVCCIPLDDRLIVTAAGQLAEGGREGIEKFTMLCLKITTVIDRKIMT